MSRVRVLPEILSNRIAAGEVVERPASVVKELTENALDAGGTRIAISVENGGRSLIEVSDNGSGMAPDDALLAVERYATSKIYEDGDLFAIGTLGFRGEALPSIASVSRFVLETRHRDAEAGIRVEMSGGILRKVTEIGAPPGTLVAVRDLFFNTPARRKFLKSVSTEMSHIADTVANLAMAWPGVSFTLHHDGREVKSWPAAGDAGLRVSEILGRGVSLLRVERSADGISLAGWIGSPDDTRSTSRSAYLYVNGRYVRDRVVQHALVAGYRGRIMKGRFPVAVLFVTVPPDRVDVNVHPAKSEVRFADPERVHRLVEAAVAEALHQAGRPGRRPPAGSGPAPGPAPPPAEAPWIRPSSVAEAAPSFRPAPDPPAEAAGTPPASSPAPMQIPVWEKRFFQELSVIGQFQETYILCEAEGHLVIIDQHAAHERIYFEQLTRRGRQVRQASQRLLLPETLDLNFQEADILRSLLPSFEAVGMEIEPFSGNTFAVKSLPAFLAGKPAAPLIAEVLEKTAEIGVAAGTERIVEESLMVMACHGAIRAHRRLSRDEIRHLLAQMDACETPSTCPHGRPTWIRWSVRFLEKAFRRIV